MATIISDTACIDPRAELADEVEVGPYCVIGPDVRIGRGTRLIAHVCILSGTSMGTDNIVSPFVVLGGEPEGSPQTSGPSHLEIGDRNIFREGVTIQRGLGGSTRIGHDNRLSAGVQVAQNCCLGDRIALGQNVGLAGHVHVGSNANLSAGVGSHPYVTIGLSSFVGAGTYLYHDVPPYMVADGHPAKVRCINIVGLKRAGMDREEIDALHEAHRLLFRARVELEDAAEICQAHGQKTPTVELLLRFLRDQREGRHGRARDRSRSALLPETPGHS
ncbi:acyl-ACP--UDP-N-acetylglucosamine O-acyltransferase [soil metagenome]